MKQKLGPTADASCVSARAVSRSGLRPAGRRPLHPARNASRGSGTSTVVSTLLLLALALTTGGPALAQDQQDPVRIGVQAARGSEKCLERWTPTADYLTEQIPGRCFAIVPLDYDEVGPAVERGDVDFVLANPGLYAALEQRYGVSQLATLNNRPLREACTVYGGVIFCRAERNDITTLADLKGKTFMGVDERTFGGWLAAWRELKEHGIDPYRDFAKLGFGGTHDAVVYAVRDGKVDAGTVRTETLERMAMEGKVRLDDFRALAHDHSGQDPCYFPFLHSTETYPEWPLAKLARTPHELAETVAVALLSMPPDSPAAKAARCAGWTVPLNYQPVHECLKELRVEPYEDLGRITVGALVRQYWPSLAAAAVFLAMAAATMVCVLRLNRTLRRSKLDLARELSERKRAEEALKKSAKRYGFLLESITDGVHVLDRELRYVLVNDELAHMAGMPKEELLGKRITDLFPGIEETVFFKTYRKVLETGEPRVASDEFVFQDGRRRWFEAHAYPAPEGLLVIVTDITVRKRAEETARMVQVQLIAQQQYETERVQVELEKVRDELIRKTRLATIGQMSASIAHELRNPLGTVRNAAYYLKRRVPEKAPKFAEYLSIIEQETATADRIISNLMGMTRAREPIKQTVDLGRIVREVFEQADLGAGTRWRVAFDPEPFVLAADPGQLRQVLGNLLTNAVQAVEREGQILVAASRSSDYDTIMFTDDGPGVAPEARERLFEPLFSTKAKGTGLGLTICRQIIEQHGGTIELADQEGRGAAFRIRLPR